MCGIVGYVGPRPALDVVVEGLRRLEYRGYDSAGVAVIVRSTAGGCRSPRRPAGSRTWTRNSPSRTHHRQRPASATPGGPPTARRTTATRTRTLDAAGRIAVVHNGIIENFRELRAELEADGRRVRQRDRHRDRRAPGRARARCARRVRSPTPCARSAAGCRARSRSCCSTRDHPDVVVAARRNSPLVLGVGDGETFLGSDVAAFIEFTRDAVELGQDQVVEIRRDGYRSRLRRQSRRRQALPHRLGSRRRREGRLRLLHAQGDRTSSRPRSPTRCAGTSSTAQIVLDEQRLDTAGAARRRQGVRRRLRHGLPLRADRQAGHRALDPGPGRGRDGLGVPLPRPGARPADARRRDQPVRRDRRHAGGGAARAGAAGDGAGDLQHQRRADPARVRRGALHARRPGDRRRRDQDVPGPDRRGRAGRAGAGPGPRHQVRRRDRARVRGAGRGAGARSRGAGRPRAGRASSPARSRSRRRCCSSAATSATRSRSRARSSSRSSPTCTPRASRPASSSTGRSR